jgi:hypothetical protein
VLADPIDAGNTVDVEFFGVPKSLTPSTSFMPCSHALPTFPVHGSSARAVFDLLEPDGEDLRAMPLGDRKRRLARLLSGRRLGIVLSDHTDDDGDVIFRAIPGLAHPGAGGRVVRHPSRDLCRYARLGSAAVPNPGKFGSSTTELRVPYMGELVVNAAHVRAAAQVAAGSRRVLVTTRPKGEVREGLCGGME